MKVSRMSEEALPELLTAIGFTKTSFRIYRFQTLETPLIQVKPAEDHLEAGNLCVLEAIVASITKILKNPP